MGILVFFRYFFGERCFFVGTAETIRRNLGKYSIFVSIHLPVYFSICLSISLHIFLLVCLSVSLLFCLPVYLYVYLPISISVHLLLYSLVFLPILFSFPQYPFLIYVYSLMNCNIYEQVTVPLRKSRSDTYFHLTNGCTAHEENLCDKNRRKGEEELTLIANSFPILYIRIRRDYSLSYS